MPGARRAAALAVSLLFAGCAGDHSTLDPAGPSARAVATLWWIMLGGSAVIFAATTAALVLAWTRPRIFGGDPSRPLVLWGGLILPSVILVALVFAAFALGERMIGRSGSTDLLRIEAEGRRWQWEFRYPGAGGLATIDTLHVPAGREIEFSVTSTDVIHSFWVPRLGGKIDAIPGHRNTIRLLADTPGRYGGVCAEFCGTGHTVMRFEVIAHAAEDYDAVLARLAAGEAPEEMPGDRP
ncbi:cytochrome c oxidase subunit II [Methylobrevis albus]|uniref:Cytochrome aa3 subunit 2 n=1 Tax=Methylobrevis albus TaxID=2793297 RepID=A0A931I1A0_9HYPH|nr:cytochrome c oxidase subunit II [Methylobrevis albus]MBH0238365.1 cytochrome c oxidase subunit II [Methylobrevis albus]